MRRSLKEYLPQKYLHQAKIDYCNLPLCSIDICISRTCYLSMGQFQQAILAPGHFVQLASQLDIFLCSIWLLSKLELAPLDRVCFSYIPVFVALVNMYPSFFLFFKVLFTWKLSFKTQNLYTHHSKLWLLPQLSSWSLRIDHGFTSDPD